MFQVHLLWHEAKIDFKLWESQGKQRAVEITVGARIHMSILWWGTFTLNIPTDLNLYTGQDSSVNKATGCGMNGQI
jgi:hypothetical protein